MGQILPGLYLLTSNVQLSAQGQRPPMCHCLTYSPPLAAGEQYQADRFTAPNAMPSDLEIAEQAVNQVIFTFLDKHFKKYKDKGSL